MSLAPVVMMALLSDQLLHSVTITWMLYAVWEMYMGEPLYERLSKVQIMFGVMSQDMRPQFPPSAPTWLADLACQCWAANPAARSALSRPLLRHVHPVL